MTLTNSDIEARLNELADRVAELESATGGDAIPVEDPGAAPVKEGK